ncbi:MAG: hypothetical protein H6585_12035 [Flavobacteriales bacterium]|nr:hypothetical protein [Flavobacteriales bacterium]MCB9449060.1 hypothetical protein [Flavobacteriales bacterium]
MDKLWQGIIIGIAGGFFASQATGLTKWTRDKLIEWSDKRRIYEWLKKNSSDKAGHKFRSTRAISSGCNLTQDRVRYICSIHKKIYLSTGINEDLWSVIDGDEKSVYDDRGVLEL